MTKSNSTANADAESGGSCLPARTRKNRANAGFIRRHAGRCHGSVAGGGMQARPTAHSIPFILIRFDRRASDLLPAKHHTLRNVHCAEPFGHRAVLRLEAWEGQQKPLDVDKICASFRATCPPHHAYELHGDELHGRRNLYGSEGLRRRQRRCLANVDEMTARRLAHLVDTKSQPGPDLADAHGDTQSIREEGTQLFGEIGGSRSQHIDVVRHALRLAVGVDGLGAE